MQLAYTMTRNPGDLDQVLFRLSRHLAETGVNAAGVVQINSECDRDGPCDMDVQVLPDGPVIRISQSLGPSARGCRLDPAALETAVAEVIARLTDQTDVLIVNKFGKHEADGRGFRDVIAEALSRGIPVISGVNGLNRDAFLAFSGGLAVEVPAEVSDLAQWLDSARAAAAAEQVA